MSYGVVDKKVVRLKNVDIIMVPCIGTVDVFHVDDGKALLLAYGCKATETDWMLDVDRSLRINIDIFKNINKKEYIEFIEPKDILKKYPGVTFNKIPDTLENTNIVLLDEWVRILVSTDDKIYFLYNEVEYDYIFEFDIEDIWNLIKNEVKINE